MDVFERNGVFLQKKERFYVEDLTERDYLLECATPVYFKIEEITISDRTWTGIIPKIAKYLQDKFPKDTDELLGYKTVWSKAQMFSPNVRTNFTQLMDGMYINVNHTAVHSVWFIQDLLDFYDVDKTCVCLVIKRPPSIEPKEIRNHVKKEVKESFANYLTGKYKDESIKKIVDGIESLNKELSKISKGYNDFYLIDNTRMLATYKSRLMNNIKKSMKYTDDQKKIIKLYLKNYTEFCTTYFA